MDKIEPLSNEYISPAVSHDKTKIYLTVIFFCVLIAGFLIYSYFPKPEQAEDERTKTVDVSKLPDLKVTSHDLVSTPTLFPKNLPIIRAAEVEYGNQTEVQEGAVKTAERTYITHESEASAYQAFLHYFSRDGWNINLSGEKPKSDHYFLNISREKTFGQISIRSRKNILSGKEETEISVSFSQYK